MKTILPIIAAAVATITCFNVKAQTNTFPSTGAAGIGTVAPNASSLLEIKSTTKGFLMSRMTQAQRNAIATPATGLLIYQTNNTPGFYYYNGSAWAAVTAKNFWAITGNAGTDSSLNFIGTKDAHPLAFRVNNNKSGWIDHAGNKNTSLGYQTLLSNTTGANNAAFGFGALKSNISGGNNTAFGASTLFNNGIGANVDLDEATRNTAIGASSMFSNTTGLYNTALGVSSLYANTSGFFNTAIGLDALESNIDGRDNTATGLAALDANTSGSYNTSSGSRSMTYNTSGNNNTASGFAALHDNTTGYSNVAIGTWSLYKNTNGHNLVAVGDSALFNQLSIFEGGEFPVYGDNTGVGSKALFGNTRGQRNTAVGSGALYNTQGDGGQASYNTGIGFQSLLSNVFGGQNTALGAWADVNDDSRFNATAVGYGAKATADNQVMLGNTFVTSVMAAGSIEIVSDGRFKKNVKENVPGLAFINQLKPVTYNYDIHGLNNLITPTNASGKKAQNSDMQKRDEAAIAAKEKIVYTGFVAQDVAAAAKKLNYDFSGVHKPQNDKDPYALSYSEFVVPLVKAVQELSKMNDAKDSAIQQQNIKINDLQNQINELKAMIIAGQPIVSSQQSAIILSTSLQQNIPNPFSNTTSIGYTLPQKFSTAQIVITDKNGKTLKAINISGVGKGTLNVDAARFASGACQYSLIIDGKLIATKQMEHIK